MAPGVPVLEPLEAPVPVMETAEVAAARADHLKAVEEAKAATTTVERKKREAEPTDADYKVPAAPILFHAAPAPVFDNQLAQPATLVHTVTAPVSVAEPAPIPTFTAPAPIAPLPFSTTSNATATIGEQQMKGTEQIRRDSEGIKRNERNLTERSRAR